MGEDCGSRLNQQCWPSQSTDLNCTAFVPVQGMQNALPAYTSIYAPYVASVGESLTGFTSTKSPQLKTGRTNGEAQWFYCLPRHRQALTPNTKYPANGIGLVNQEYKKCVTPDAVSRPVEKRFLVFDQSGNHTNLIFSSLIGSPIQCPRLGNLGSLHNVSRDEQRAINDQIFQGGPIASDGILDNHNQESVEKSEMHEDTEELNALLYSSDEDDDFDEETSSTGHSPSKIGAHLDQEDVEEVASSGSPPMTKRKRQLDEECSSFSLMDTANSGKPSNEYEDDAESSCGESKDCGREVESPPAYKRVKRERIKETINILQNIIPGGKGKDAMLVLDEAIQYLKTLRLKANSLGEILY